MYNLTYIALALAERGGSVQAYSEFEFGNGPSRTFKAGSSNLLCTCCTFVLKKKNAASESKFRVPNWNSVFIL